MAKRPLQRRGAGRFRNPSPRPCERALYAHECFPSANALDRGNRRMRIHQRRKPAALHLSAHAFRDGERSRKGNSASIFNRTNRGITLTNEGIEFIGYARQILEQFDLFETRLFLPKRHQPAGSPSLQHYAFSVHAFVAPPNNTKKKNTASPSGNPHRGNHRRRSPLSKRASVYSI